MKPKYKVGDELVFRVDEVHDKGYTLSPGGGYWPFKYQDRLEPLQKEEHMKKDIIKVLVKKPGRPVQLGAIPNTLRAFQGAVGGYIEAVPLRPDLVMIVNDEGKLNGMQYNFRINLNGYEDMIFGPCLIVGVDGEEFDDCPLSQEDLQDYFDGLEEERHA